MSPPQLLIPAQLDHLCEAFRFMNIWIATKTAHDARSRQQQQTKTEEGQKKTSNKSHQIFNLSYQEVLPILQFLGSAIEYKTQHIWGSSGSGWGGSGDLVIIERPEISNTARFGIQIKLQVWTRGTITTAQVLQTNEETTDGRMKGKLAWKSEPNSTRSTKPVDAEIQFREVVGINPSAPTAQPMICQGFVRFPGEGKLDFYGRLRTYDPKTGDEVPNADPVKEHAGARRPTDKPQTRATRHLYPNLAKYP